MGGGRVDVAVIGGGVHGLAAAVRLAAGGRRVVVLERRAALGGLAAPIEISPGYTVPGVLHDEGLVRPAAVARLGLAAHGLAFRDAPGVLLAEPGGPGISLPRDSRDPGADTELAARSPKDAAAYAEYRRFLAGVAPFVERVMASPPPPLSPDRLADWIELGGRAVGLLRLGRERATELARVAPMCVADFLNERFDTPLLVEGLAAPAVAATFAGPWSAGTTTNLLLAECAPGRFVAGGPAGLVAALERAARAAGVEIRTGAEVARIAVADGRATGIVLAGGETIDAAAVLATCDPKTTFLRLIEPGTLPVAIEREFRRIRSRGSAAKLHLALAGPLAVAGRNGAPIESLRVGGGHVDELERAFDALKYREVSRAPHLEVRVPSVADTTLAPAGHHVVSILASFAPREIEGGWTPARRHALQESILDRLESIAPGTRSRLVGSQLLTPEDLEREYGLWGGQLHHVEPALDQLLVMRPAPSAARYASAVPGLFLGGSGSHAGGGLTLGAGLLAAETLLATR